MDNVEEKDIWPRCVLRTETKINLEGEVRSSFVMDGPFRKCIRLKSDGRKMFIDEFIKVLNQCFDHEDS